MIYEALIQVFLVLLEHPEKATVYFVLAVISGFLISSTCLCGHWVALKLAPVTHSRPPRPYRPMIVSNTMPTPGSPRQVNIPPFPRTYPPTAKNKFSRSSGRKKQHSSPPGLVRSRSFVSAPKVTSSEFVYEEDSWPQQRLAAASSVPDFVGNNYEFEEESFEELVQQDYGFLYYNNNPAPNSQQQFSWVYVRETLV